MHAEMQLKIQRVWLPYLMRRAKLGGVREGDMSRAVMVGRTFSAMASAPKDLATASPSRKVPMTVLMDLSTPHTCSTDSVEVWNLGPSSLCGSTGFGVHGSALMDLSTLRTCIASSTERKLSIHALR